MREALKGLRTSSRALTQAVGRAGQWRMCWTWDKDTVSPYLLNAPLSRAGRVKLFIALSWLREQGDVFIDDLSRRLAQGSPFFLYDYIFRDDDGDGQLHHFRFVVSDAAASYGVLRVVYVDQLGTASK
jgi:hypothetical protein